MSIQRKEEHYALFNNQSHSSAHASGSEVASPPLRSAPSLSKISYSTLELCNAELPPVSYLVDKIIGSGLSLLAGPPKSGKSCLGMVLADAVANGKPFLRSKATYGEVLYFTFEDTFSRVKERVKQMHLTPSNKFHIVTQQYTLVNGLCECICNFKSAHPGLVLVIIDTLQLIRDPSRKMSYGNDVDELATLKQLAHELGISILAVHHTRKGSAECNPLERVSGTTGLTGTADTILILDRNVRSTKAKLQCVGKDIGAIELDLSFEPDTLTFELSEKAIDEAPLPPQIARLIETVLTSGGFSGDNDEFANWLSEHIDPNISISRMRQLTSQYSAVLTSLGILVTSHRTAAARGVEISYTRG